MRLLNKVIKNEVVVLLKPKASLELQQAATQVSSLRRILPGERAPLHQPFFFIVGKGQHAYKYLNDPILGSYFKNSFLHPDKVEPGMCFMFQPGLKRFTIC